MIEFQQSNAQKRLGITITGLVILAAVFALAGFSAIEHPVHQAALNAPLQDWIKGAQPSETTAPVLLEQTHSDGSGPVSVTS
nr:hypothetical protein [uncultured Methanoregula sp.]